MSYYEYGSYMSNFSIGSYDRKRKKEEPDTLRPPPEGIFLENNEQYIIDFFNSYKSDFELNGFLDKAKSSDFVLLVLKNMVFKNKD